MIEKLMELLIDNLPFAIWIKDMSGKYLIVNKQFKNHYGYDKEYVINKYTADVFPKEIADKYIESDNLVIKENREKIFRRKKDNKTLEVFIKPLRDINGNIIGICGCTQDITDRLEYEEEIITQKDLLKTLFDNIPDAIFYKDTKSNYLGCNLVCSKEFINKDEKDIIGKNDLEIYKNKEMAQSFIDRDKEIMKNKEKKYTEAKFTLANGEIRYMESIKAPILNENEEVIGLVGISRNITERKKLEERLRELSYRDNLTGLYNRNYFEKVTEELDNEEDKPLSIIMGDINGLKIINDTLGHLQGDKLIVEIAEVIKSCVSKDNIVIRWGGDEIVILLPNTSEIEAKKLSQVIIMKCKKISYGKISASISLGISSRINKEKHIYTMLKEADEELYRRKIILKNDCFKPC